MEILTYCDIRMFCGAAEQHAAVQPVGVQPAAEQGDIPRENGWTGRIPHTGSPIQDERRDPELEIVVHKVELWDNHAASYLHGVRLVMGLDPTEVY